MTERCDAYLSGGNPEYRCVLLAGHDQPHEDKHNNQWTLTINIYQEEP